MLNTITIAGKQAYSYLPADYNSSTSYPCLIFLPGLGETKGAVTELNVHGPFLYINSTTNLNLELIIIAIEPNEQYGDTIAETQAYLNGLNGIYNISKFYFTGLSLGCQEWMNWFWQPGQNLSQVGGLFMFSSDPPNQPPYGTADVEPSLFNKYPIFFYGGCGTADSMYGMEFPLYQAIVAAKPQIAPAWDAWQGVGHGDPVWSQGYNPTWKSPSMGVSIYQKVVSLSAPVVVTPPPIIITSIVPNQLPTGTTAQKLGIQNPKEGMQVYDLTLHQTSYYNGTTWINV